MELTHAIERIPGAAASSLPFFDHREAIFSREHGEYPAPFVVRYSLMAWSHSLLVDGGIRQPS